MKRMRPDEEADPLPQNLHQAKRFRFDEEGTQLAPVVIPDQDGPEPLPTQIPDGSVAVRLWKKEFLNSCSQGKIQDVKTMLGHPLLPDLIVCESFVLDTFQAVCRAKQKQVLDFLLSHPYGAAFWSQDALVSWALAITRYSRSPHYLPILSHPSHNFAVPRITLMLCAGNCGTIPVVGEPFDVWKLIFGFLVRLQFRDHFHRHSSFQGREVVLTVSFLGTATIIKGVKGMPFWMIKESFCRFYGLNPDHIDFTLKGQRISARRTPQLLFHGFSATLEAVPALPPPAPVLPPPIRAN